MGRETEKSEVVAGVHYATGKPVTVNLDGRKIESVRAWNVPHKGLPLVAPGLVDLQINGFGGHDFNSPAATEKTAEEVTRALWREGVTSYFPTVITNSGEGIEKAVGAIAKACEGAEFVREGIAGIHLEGPFICLEDGPRGAHDRAHVRAPSWDLFRRWQEAAGGRIRILTMSPEWPGSAEFIARCVEAKVTVSIGHTAATPAQIREAVGAGARMSTHLGNGSHVQIRRHPNYIWEQLAQDGLWATMIADGFHLPDSVLKVFMRVKGEKAVLVSDAVYLSGLDPGAYDTHIGGKVVLTPQGKLHTAANPDILAGSAQMLGRGVEHLVLAGLCGLGEAWEMCSTRPAGLMGMPARQGLKVGAPADVVVFDWNGESVGVQKTYKKGKRVFERARRGHD